MRIPVSMHKGNNMEQKIFDTINFDAVTKSINMDAIDNILNSTTFMFDGKRSYHMLNCYNNPKSHKKWWKIAQNVMTHPEWEICVTNEKSVFTQYTLIVEGDMLEAYREDCQSYVNKAGHRVAHFKNCPKCEGVFEWDMAYLPEGFLNNIRVVGVMVRLDKNNIEKAQKEFNEVYDFCKYHGLELHIWTSDIVDYEHINIQKERYL